MKKTISLLWPWIQGVNNSWSRGKRENRLKALFFTLLGLAFWSALFAGSYLFFGRLAQEEPFGRILIEKLISFVFLIFFAVLVFSNIVTSLNTYFLSDDLYLFFSAPVSFESLYVARYLQTMILSSWMVLMFALPVFIANGMVFDAPWFYYPWMAVVLLAFLLLPCALATMVTMILVKAFPARKMQDILIILAIVFIVVLYFLLRFLQPEQLFNPDVFHGFTEYFATLQTPDSSIMPTTWANMAMLSGFNWEALVNDGFFNLAMLIVNGMMAALLGATLANRIYFDAYSKSQEGRNAKVTSSAAATSIFNSLIISKNRVRRELMLKDIKTFFRETTQWSQLFLLSALIVVYLFNYKVLHLERYAGITFDLRSTISYLNIVLAGFVMAAICVRFVLPAVSIEGRAFWILRTAPIKMKNFLWSKYMFSIVPVFVISEVLIIVSNIFLKTSDFLMILSAVIMGLISFCIVALAIGIGAMFPNFEEKNVARMSSGASSIIFMVISVGFILIVIGLMASPAIIWHKHIINHTMASSMDWTITLISAALILFLASAAIYFPMKKGIHSLESME